MQAESSNTTRVARSFVDARRGGVALADYPGTAPGNLSEAYAVQDAALALDGRAVAGWKVGKIDPPRDGANRLAGPIFADQVVVPGEGEVPAMPVFASGFAAAEAEFLLRIGQAPEPGRAYSIEEAAALIDAVHLGIEIASSPYPRINADGPAVTVSDFGNNNGLVVGALLDGWRSLDLGEMPVTLLVNGERVGAATAATMLDGPFGAARFLFEHLGKRGVPLAPGQWISSGAVTGVHPVAVGDEVEARFGAGGDDRRVRCTIAG